MSERELALQSDLVAGRICLQASDDLKKEVFVSMKNDVISKVAKGDPLIVALGNLSMKRNIGNKVMRRYNVSSDMRLVARALIELRELQEEEDAKKNLTWYDAFTPDQYPNIVKAIFAVCCKNLTEAKQGDDDVDLKLPSIGNAIKLSFDIARLVSIKRTAATWLIVETDNMLGENIRKDTERFMELFKYNWSSDVKDMCAESRRTTLPNMSPPPPPLDEATPPQTHDEDEERQKHLPKGII
jgi:hypothetical protein